MHVFGPGTEQGTGPPGGRSSGFEARLLAVSFCGLSHRSSRVSVEERGQVEVTELTCEAPPHRASTATGPTTAHPGPPGGPDPGVGEAEWGRRTYTWRLGGLEEDSSSGIGRGPSGAFPACCASFSSDAHRISEKGRDLPKMTGLGVAPRALPQPQPSPSAALAHPENRVIIFACPQEWGVSPGHIGPGQVGEAPGREAGVKCLLCLPALT